MFLGVLLIVSIFSLSFAQNEVPVIRVGVVPAPEVEVALEQAAQGITAALDTAAAAIDTTTGIYSNF